MGSYVRPHLVACWLLGVMLFPLGHAGREGMPCRQVQQRGAGTKQLNIQSRRAVLIATAEAVLWVATRNAPATVPRPLVPLSLHAIQNFALGLATVANGTGRC